MTSKAIESVNDTAGSIPVETIVVDDGSRDGSGAYLKTRYPEITLISNPTSRGFTVVNNQALEVARGEYLLLLNNDAELLPGCLRLMVEYLDDHPDVGVVGSKLLLTDDPTRLDSAMTFLLPFGYIKYVGWGAADDPSDLVPVPVFTVKGACALTRVTLLRKYGFLVEDYFAYFEETELCWRLWLFGFKSMYLPAARTLHGLGKTTSKLPSPYLDYHSFKNRLATTLTHYELKSLAVALPGQVAVILASIGYYVTRRRFANAYAVARALAWNVRRFPKTMVARSYVQRHRVISDGDLMRTIGSKFSALQFLRHAIQYGKSRK